MTIQHHYYIKYTEKLLDFLDSKKIKYEFSVSAGNILLDICENNKHFAEFMQFIPEDAFCTKKYVFSKKELDEAKWLTMRCTNQKFEAQSWEETFEYSCTETRTAINHRGKPEIHEYANHGKQIAPYQFTKANIKWGKSSFCGTITGGRDTIFCNDNAVSVIESNGLTGLSFAPVLQHRKNVYLENVHQLVFDNIIPDEKTQMQGLDKVWHCPHCGKKKYMYNSLSRLVIDRDALGEQDFYSTEENYHYWSDETRPQALFIVSQRAYRVLKENRMTGTLEFFPLLTK